MKKDELTNVGVDERRDEDEHSTKQQQAKIKQNMLNCSKMQVVGCSLIIASGILTFVMQWFNLLQGEMKIVYIVVNCIIIISAVALFVVGNVKIRKIVKKAEQQKNDLSKQTDDINKGI